HILDVNMGVPDADETDLMVRAIRDIQAQVPAIPLSIDSNDPDTLIQGLHEVIGRPLLNSISGETERMERLLPAVYETGANFIALAMDETGIPADAEARMKIIRRIIDQAEMHGISRDRILVDCLVFTVGSQPHQARETLTAVERVRRELGCATILGVSNVSFGLPRRAVLSSAFLAMAMQAGLNAGIINPLSDRMMETLRAAELLLNRDAGARNYVSLMEAIESRTPEDIQEPRRSGGAVASAPKRTTPAGSPGGSGKCPDEPQARSTLQETIVTGDKSGVIPAIDNLIAGGMSPGDILASELVPAIEEVGRQYGAGKIYLPQLILAGETMRTGVDHLRPKLILSDDRMLHNTPFILGTVSGDIHDIGKNIVAIVLENQGFQVIDLGKNVPLEQFVESVRKYNAPIAGLSALMTTTMPAMEVTVNGLRDACPGVRIMVGGAVVTQAFADRIGADGYTREAVAAGAMARQIAGID
ncbi:MAG TPA: dihydropteroate synthase, partial [bacterium]|nr:dihydropteroate synthase [bacterium]